MVLPDPSLSAANLLRLASKAVGATITNEMPATNSRDQMIEALRELPPDATVDDAIERLVLLAKIEAGLAELDRGEGIPHDEARRRLGV